MDQHDSLSAPVQSGRCGGLLACPAERQQKADHCRLHGICAGAHPEQRVLCPQFQLLCPVVLYAGAHPCGHDGERVGGPQPRPRPPRPEHCLCDDRHAGLCTGARAGCRHQGVEPGRAAESGPVLCSACLWSGRSGRLPLHLQALAAAQGLCPPPAGRRAGVQLPVRHRPHRHWQVRPVEHRQ